MPVTHGWCSSVMVFSPWLSFLKIYFGVPPEPAFKVETVHIQFCSAVFTNCMLPFLPRNFLFVCLWLCRSARSLQIVLQMCDLEKARSSIVSLKAAAYCNCWYWATEHTLGAVMLQQIKWSCALAAFTQNLASRRLPVRFCRDFLVFCAPGHFCEALRLRCFMSMIHYCD